MRQPSHLFRQLLLLVAAVSAPLLLLQAYNLHRQSREASDAASRAVANYASSVAHDAETLLVDTRQYLAFLSARPQVLALDRDRCDPLLEGVTRRRRHVANVLVVDADGHPLCLSAKGPGTVPDVLTGFDWFRRARASDATTLSKPFFAPIVQKTVVAMAHPLTDGQGRRIGTLAVLLDLEGLQDDWARFDLPPNSRMSIFDEDGTIIATRPDFRSMVGKDANAVLRHARALNPGDIGIAPGVDGVERAFALRPVPAAGWHAGAAIPTSFVFGPSRAQFGRSLAIACVVIAATFSFAYVMARRMVRPLHDLVAVARAVRAGRDPRAAEDAPGEFRELSREFNAMLDAGRRHADFYRALSRTNGAIVRSADEQSLYDEICRICVEEGHASIAYVSRVRGSTMEHVAWSGPAEDFVRGLDVRPGDSGMARSGLSGLAAWTGVCQVSNDVDEDPRTVPWRALGAAIGTKAIAACPFHLGGVTSGTLTLHMTVPGFFDERVLALLEEMTEDISFALDNFVRNAALAREKQKLAGLVDTAMDAIISVDTSHRIRLINRAACEMFGVRQDQALGTPIDRFIPSRLHAAHAAHLQNFASTGSTARRMGIHDLVAVRADGTEFPIDASISKLGNDEDTLMTVVVRDATELRAAQRARIAQVAAESASRAKTDFLSRMSHELRTPLNAVLGFSQLLQSNPSEPLSPAQHGHVEHIRVAGWHLLALINDVLDVSKIEGGHVSLHEQAVDLPASLDEAIRINQPGADAAGIRLVPTYRGDKPAFVLADPQRLRQVVINLVSNAIKYNRPDGTVDIRIGGDRHTTHVDVVDTGIGMSPEQLEHLYEPFNRLGRERHGIEGTGLGLTLARHLTQLMGGALDVRSAPGAGTQVRVTLRTHAGDGQAEIVRHPADHTVPPTASLAGTVLYIEDNPINAMLVQQLLHRWPGVDLLLAETGVEGLSLARTAPVDLILLDMRLPDLDGLQMLRELHQHPGTRSIRVIALSASAMPEDVEAAHAAGALQYWTKPLDFARFIEDMQGLLGKPSVEPQPRPTTAPGR